MATYNNQFASKINITPANPNLRGLEDNFSNDGQRNLGGEGLGNIYQLDYDRNAIENIFNQGTDAQYALMQKEARVAENNYANQQFQAQQDTLNTLRAQRNEQIASGMARGLNAAADQATALGIQQESMNGALELAQNRQMQADQIAAEYANNVVKALQESNAVKQAMAQVAAQLYEADMLGYTGELGYLGQMDANAVNKYASELGLEGTQYTANKALEGTKYNADMNYKGTVYNADRNYAAQVAAANAQAAATRYAADVSARAQQQAAAKGVDINKLVADYGTNPAALKSELMANGVNASDADVKTMTNNYWASQLGFADYNDLLTQLDKKFAGGKSTMDKLAQNAIKSYQTTGKTSWTGKELGYNFIDGLVSISPTSWFNSYK